MKSDKLWERLTLLKYREKKRAVRECIAILLVGLPEEYNIKSTLIEHDAAITFGDAVEVLKAHEEKLQSVNRSSSSSLTSSTIANVRSNSESKKKRKQDPCTFCGKTNHRAKNCWENPPNSERNHNRVQSHKRRGNHQQNRSQRWDNRAQQVDVNIPILMMRDVKNDKFAFH